MNLNIYNPDNNNNKVNSKHLNNKIIFKINKNNSEKMEKKKVKLNIYIYTLKMFIF